MKPEIAKIWTDALLSDKYPQGNGALCVNGKYCCLGVLCELYNESPENKDNLLIVETHNNGMKSYDTYLNFLPKKVREWACMVSNNGDLFAMVKVDKFISVSSLAGMNDYGCLFPRIASTIKEQAVFL